MGWKESAAKHAPSQIADAFDARAKRRAKELEEWVQDNPQWWAIALATVGKSSMDFTAGLVDVVRFGEGMAEGGLGGGAKDVLRLVGLLGPLGRGAAMARAGAYSLLGLRLAVRVRGVSAPCTFQAVGNALSLTKGQQVFLTVREMAKAKGVPFKSLVRNDKGQYVLGAYVDDLVGFIRMHGAKVTEIRGVTQISQLFPHVARNRVVIFAFRTKVRYFEKGVWKVRDVHHSVILARDALGRTRFADYGGTYFETLEELCKRWGQVIEPIRISTKGATGASGMVVEGIRVVGPLFDRLIAGTVLVIEGVTAVETVSDGIDLAFEAEVVGVPAADGASAAPPEVIQGSLQAFTERKAGRKVIRLPEMYVRAGAGVAPPVGKLTGVQFRLNALGFGAGPVDGIFGPRTKRAVRAFQREYPPLAADGVPGPATQARLVEVCGY